MNILLKELDTLGLFMFNTKKELMETVFFSTQAQYISFYSGLVDELVKVRNKAIFYLTSDAADPLLMKTNDRIVSRFSNSFLPLIFPLIDSPVLITTIPDLHQYKIKRSFLGTNYVYMFHSLVSTHMMYRKGAFDFYDTVFCPGPYHAAEIRLTEKAYGLPPKTIHEVGYYRLERIYNNHQAHQGDHPVSKRNSLVLIAPGWQPSNILDVCIDDLVDSLLAEGFDVVVRPHPMTIRNSPDKLKRLRLKYSAADRFSIDVDTSTEYYLHVADVMISDWSGVALEYAFGTERPVLFIDLPRKIYNPEYEKIGIEPVEVRVREQIGALIKPEVVNTAGKIVGEFITRRDEYRERIIAVREDVVCNFGRSHVVGADIIQDVIARGIKGDVRPR